MNFKKKALVCGAGGFIGGHLVKRLKQEEYWVRGVDLKYPEFSKTSADEFVIGDLREQSVCRAVADMPFDEVYQLAADMGGAGYIFTGTHDANVMHNSATINLNMAEQCHRKGVGKIFYSSSACMYPEYNQMNPSVANLIVVQKSRHRVRIGFWEYFRVGGWVTAVSIAAGVGWLLWRG